MILLLYLWKTKKKQKKGGRPKEKACHPKKEGELESFIVSVLLLNFFSPSSEICRF